MKHSEVFSALESRKFRNPEEYHTQVKGMCGPQETHSNCHSSSASHVGPCSGTAWHTCTGGAQNTSPPCSVRNVCSPMSSYYTPGCCIVSVFREEPGV
jgi:hypothetical protein